ncbi:MAG: hypothetical protein RL317_943 [Pseudomonadota bacterium]
MKFGSLILILGALLTTLAGCGKIEPGTKPEEESARQIANRAQEISAAADAAVNQQISDILDSERSAADQAPQNGAAPGAP